jgi:hypothetical protein
VCIIYSTLELGEKNKTIINYLIITVMKKNYAFFVLLISMSISNQVFGQKTLTESFDYPIGSLMGQGTATSGWAGPWAEGLTTGAGGILNAIDGNFGNDIGKTAELKLNSEYSGSNNTLRVTRDFDTNSTFVDNTPGQEIWISFYFKNTIESGLNSSQSYLQLSDPLGPFSCPPIGSLPVSSTTPGTLGMNQAATSIAGTLETDLTYILVKLVLDGAGVTNGDIAYMWTNYTGTTAPDIATAQATRTFTVGSAAKVANISRVNLFTYRNRIAYFDKVRISNTFAPNGSSLKTSAFDFNLFDIQLMKKSNQLKLSVVAEEIVVMDVQGREVLKSKGDLVDVSMLNNGVYIVKATYEGKSAVKKVLKD